MQQRAECLQFPAYKIRLLLISALLVADRFALTNCRMSIEGIAMKIRIVVIAAVILAVLGISYLFWDYMTVDSCLDRGGRWDKSQDMCVDTP